MNYFGRRYIDAQAFKNEIGRLKIVRSHVSDSYLENLEQTRLVIPRLRIRYPDIVFRSLWLDAHQDVGAMNVAVEPAGPRLEAAFDLENAIYRRAHQRVYGRLPHPLDDLDSRFAEFVHRPSERAFVPWSDFRVEVSNESYSELYDAYYTRTLYSSWQVLQAAEMAEMGIHILVNLDDEKKLESALQIGMVDSEMPKGPISVPFTPIYLLRDFSTHEAALDAVVWFVEESAEALGEITPKQSGRYILSADETKQYNVEQQAIVHTACDRYRVNGEQLIELAKFLGERWRTWDGDGRPLIAEEYRRYLAKTVLLAQLGAGMDFDTVRTGIGFSWGDHFLLDTAFPDWAEIEKDRARKTLNAMIRDPDNNIYGINEADIEAFVEFIDKDKAGLHAFFWRLHSFEEHALRGYGAYLAGMRSDLQGMAVVVEHVVRAIGRNKVRGIFQLYKVFEELWKGSDVAKVMGEAANLTRPVKGRPPTDWAVINKALEELAQSGSAERRASDLIMAHRIRGAVHYTFDEKNHLELERLFVLLMRAALLTFVHVRPV